MGVHAQVMPTPGRATRSPLDAAAVAIDGGLWADRLATVRDRSIPHGHAMLEASGALGNLRHAARGSGRYVGGLDDAGITFPFLDSDVYKWLEAVGWQLGRAPSATIAAMADEAIDLVVRAQAADGYVNSFVQLSGRERWSDLQWGHELYCIGHLVQAAVAWHRALDDDRLLRVAVRAADCVARAFLGDGGVEGVDGHPEIEMALVELSRCTGQERHLALARELLGRRGHGSLGEGRFGSDYWQDRVPVRDAPAVTGHAVRQLYLECGAVDIAVETDDAALLHAVTRRWEEMQATRTYLTGGVGAHHRDEAFGAAWELPPDRAYTETCAAIAAVMLGWRLLLATGDERYADAIERTLLNAVLPGLSADGQAFLYVNPLQWRDAGDQARRPVRRPWYPCACCPPNIMRVVSSIEQLLASTDATGLRLHQYAAGTLSVPLGDGTARLRIGTDYPYRGDVTIDVLEAPTGTWDLGLRVPAWAGSASLSVNDHPAEVLRRPGGLSISRGWRAGDRVRLALPVAPRLTAPDPRIDAVRGCVAVERGPLVYCLEGADLPTGVELADVALDTQVPPRDQGEHVVGVPAVEVALCHRPRAIDGWPYRPLDAREPDAPDGRLRVGIGPYAGWAEREPSPMRVWVHRCIGQGIGWPA
ncbi:MAG: glycoside hydrolase family 127 protein [Chloroflexota bacterium]